MTTNDIGKEEDFFKVAEGVLAMHSDIEKRLAQQLIDQWRRKTAHGDFAGAPESSDLEDARHEFWEEAAHEGAVCALCGKYGRIYANSMDSTMVVGLLAILRAGGDEKFVHAPSLKLPGRDMSHTSRGLWWGFVEAADTPPENGARKSGWWKLTEKGVRFLRGEITAPKVAVVYDADLRHLEGPEINVREALGLKFSYEDLMAATPETV